MIDGMLNNCQLNSSRATSHHHIIQKTSTNVHIPLLPVKTLTELHPTSHPCDGVVCRNWTEYSGRSELPPTPLIHIAPSTGQPHLQPSCGDAGTTQMG